MKTIAASAVSTACMLTGTPTFAQQERALGLDISAWQGNISQSTWNSFHNTDGRQFIMLRASRGGTTGFYNQNDSDNSNGQNTFSQRYDDPYFIQNINRVIASGMFAGAYHFSRPDIIEDTLNSGGIANNGTDEANHFIQMAGPWMRPGYLVPIHDFEDGEGSRTDNEMAQFCIDFSDRIYEVMGIRPGVYTSGNYASSILGGASTALRDKIAKPSSIPPSVVSPGYPTLWSARWPNQSDPDSIDVQNGEPKDSYSPIYGPWDDYGTEHPWKFWQYASTGRLQSFKNGGANLDMDVARGGIEFLKDCLVPAVWMNNSSGNWSTLANWNSGQTPVAPVQGPGQAGRVGTLTMPSPRLPGAAGPGVTTGLNDTVILERPNANITVTFSSGAFNIRKLYMRETLNLTGGSLTINYVPSWDSTTNGAEFSGPVSMSGSASLNVHTLQVDAAKTFTVGGGTVTFNTIKLMPHSSTPAKILASGNATVNPLANATAVVERGTGSGSSGLIDFGGGNRVLTIGNGSAAVDLSLEVPLNNGGFTKLGSGTMRLTAASSYAGGTTVSAGTLLVDNSSGSGTGSGNVTVTGGILGGTGTIAGALNLNSGGTLSPGASIGTLRLNSAPTLNGTIVMEINRNGGAASADKIIVTSGALNYGGTLNVSNVGATLTGGEVFNIFSASSYGSVFANAVLPALNGGLNWYLGGLTENGTIKVNRHPSANPLAVTNNFPGMLKIPIATLAGNGSDVDGDGLSLSSFGATTNGVTLTSDGAFLTYSSSANVADKFDFVIADGHGGAATNTVSIAPIVMGGFAARPDVDENSVTLHFSGTAGATYYVDRSTNLPPIWLTISTNVAPQNGLFNFTDGFDDLAQPPSSAFYRLRW